MAQSSAAELRREIPREIIAAIPMRPSDEVRLIRRQWGADAKFGGAPARPAKAGLGCAWVFIAPMLAIGAYAIGNAALDLLGGRAEEAKGAGLLAIMCFMTGGGLALALTRRYRQEALHTQAVEANRDTPWAVRPDWAAGIIKAESPSKITGSILTTVVVLVAVFPIASGLTQAPLDARNPIVIAAAAIFLSALAVAVRTVARYAKFGGSQLQLETVPGVVGRSLRGAVHIRPGVDVRGDARVRLRCLRSIQSTGDPDRADNPTVVTDTFWEEVQSATPEHGADGGIRIPVAFALPSHVPSLSDNDGLIWYRYELAVDGDTSGVDFHAAFDVPVYRTADTGQPPAAKEMALVDAVQPEHYSRPRESRIRVSTRGREVTIEFPPARNALLALPETLWAVALAALTGWLAIKGAGAFVFFPGGFAARATIRSLDRWLRASRVTAGEGTIKVALGWLVPGRTRTYPASSIDDLSLKNGEQLMGTLYYDIVLEVGGRAPRRVGRGIRDKREAEWLISRLVTALESTESPQIPR